MADDPIAGFGARITQRARLPATAIASLPILVLLVGLLKTLIASGFNPVEAFKTVRGITIVIFSPAVIPAAVFAIFREIHLHELLEKAFGVRKAVGAKISRLMAELAKECGYDHPERIAADESSAMKWFYFHINESKATRVYAFEIWEGFYASLYILLASTLSFLSCAYLALISGLMWIWWTSLVPLMLFAATWFRLKYRTIPKIMDIPDQQVRDIERDSSLLKQARERFGA